MEVERAAGDWLEPARMPKGKSRLATEDLGAYLPEG
jgi:hypothetical protein